MVYSTITRVDPIHPQELLRTPVKIITEIPLLNRMDNLAIRATHHLLNSRSILVLARAIQCIDSILLLFHVLKWRITGNINSSNRSTMKEAVVVVVMHRSSGTNNSSSSSSKETTIMILRTSTSNRN